MEKLKAIWLEATGLYSSDDALLDEFWTEIQEAYNNRAYHNLNHLSQILENLHRCRELINQWDVVVLATFYHDIVYVPGSSENELNSARLAEERMYKIGFPKEQLELCIKMILATKSHQQSDNSDTNYFLDADMSILGSDENEYFQYAEAIRKENEHFSGEQYKIGRTKVLNSFLACDNLFHTSHFRDLLELKARKNIAKELEDLYESN